MKKLFLKKLFLMVIAKLCTLIAVLFTYTATAQTIHLKTENYPPFNMEGVDATIIGVSTEIVETLFKRAEIDYTIELLPWQRAFASALKEKDTAVFSTTRTEERENKFRWVGPIVANNWVFLAKEKRNISISHLEEAQAYAVGGYQGDAVALYLEEQGFDLDLTPRDNLNALKIQRDRIDLWATGHLLGPYQAKELEVYGLKPIFTFRETIMSIAFNLNTDIALINKLNNELKRMKAENIFSEIQAKYQ